MLIFLTGTFGSGKTTSLLALLKKAEAAGLCVGGVISPGVFKDGEKLGIDALLLPQKQLLRFAVKARANDGSCKSGWEFKQETFDAVNKHLQNRQESLLIIDEIGPQELIHQRGFMSALDILDNQSYINAVVVIRPSLICSAKARWNPDYVINREDGLNELEKALERIAV